MEKNMEKEFELESGLYEECDSTNDTKNKGLEEIEAISLDKDTIQTYVRLSGEDLDNFIEQAINDFNAGITEAFDRVFKHYQPILERLSYRQNNEDLVQELSMVLFRVMQTFKSNKGAKFNTYFWKCAQNQLGSINVYNKAKKRTAENGTISMQQCYSSEKSSDVQLEAFLEDNDAKKFQESSVFKISLRDNIYPLLKEDEIIACEMIQEGYGLEAIGKKLGGISAPAVHVKLRRLANKKNIGKKLKKLYNEEDYR